MRRILSYTRFVPTATAAVASGFMFSNREAEACGIVGVVGAPKDKDDARGFLIEGLQVQLIYIIAHMDLLGSEAFEHPLNCFKDLPSPSPS